MQFSNVSVLPVTTTTCRRAHTALLLPAVTGRPSLRERRLKRLVVQPDHANR
jgi:hypothetical protein